MDRGHNLFSSIIEPAWPCKRPLRFAFQKMEGGHFVDFLRAFELMENGVPAPVETLLQKLYRRRRSGGGAQGQTIPACEAGAGGAAGQALPKISFLYSITFGGFCNLGKNCVPIRLGPSPQLLPRQSPKGILRAL